LSSLQRTHKSAHLWHVDRLIPTQHERPDTRIYKQVQRRDRSFL
jgi:hypothetical protein